jgi:ferredoxin
MTLVRFVSADGEKVQEVMAAPGDNLLDVAQGVGQPLEGTCEGQMACSTCHVIIDPADFALLPRASEEEEDMLDLAAATTRTSRLACQIMLTAAIEVLTVRIPPESRNMQGI